MRISFSWLNKKNCVALLVFITPVALATTSLAVRDNENLLESLDLIYKFLVGVAYIAGVGFTLMGLYRLKKFGTGSAFMHDKRSMIGPAALFIIGIILMYTPRFLKVMMGTLYGNDSVMAYENLSEDATFREMMRPLIGIIQVVGLIAFIRGFILVSKSTGEGAPPGSMSKGVIHIVGGVLAVNIVGTVELVTNTLGNSS